jgi:Ca2+-binding RTX toxin-like protein
MTSSLLPILPVVDDVLFNFAQSDDFWANLAIAFGTSYDVVKATQLRQQWKSRNFSQIPPIEVLSDEVLGTANGAYSSSTNKIYLSASFLNTASSAAIVNVILEEIGHYVDAQINPVDSAGDEGAIFAELVQVNSLDVATLDALRAENDQTTIIVNGESIQVEQANFTGTNGNDNIIGTSGDDTINPLRGQDNVNGGDGNDLLIVNYSSNTYAGTTTFPAGISSSIFESGGAWNGSFSAYTNSSGNFDSVNFSNIERFQITGTTANDYFDRGGYGVFNIDGGTGTDTIGTLDLSSFTTNLTIDNSGGTFTESNGNVVRNVERFNNLTTGTGNDSITFTGSFNETIATGEGDDTISAARGQDNVNGGDGNDLLIVNYSSNTYAGTTTFPAGISSSIFESGGAWNGSFSAYTNSSGNFDSVNFSNIERFQITGTTANDTITTGGGNDIITGVNPNSSTPGKGEVDSLTGGAGSDRFILGDLNWIGYDDGNTTNAGINDYANIIDFDADDFIQLRGSSSDYLLTVSGTTTNLYINKPGSEPDELIAILRDRTGLSLTASYFNYVSNITLPSITLAVSPSSVTEDGTTNLVYTFTRSGVTTNALTVNYTVGGTATLNTDYTRTGTTNTVTFAAGSSTATVTVDPTADTTVESDETVILTLAAGTGYTVGTTTAVTGTITNVTLPSITLAVAPSSVTEDGTTNLVYTFTRTGVTTNSLTVNYSISGTATNGTDYTSIPTSVTFAAGSSTATVTVDPTADTTVESDETVALTLTSGTGYTVGTTTAVAGTITNDDFPSITLAVSPSPGSVTEDGTTNLLYIFTRTGSTTNPLTVNYTVGGTATNGTDYPSIPTSVTFAAGSSTATVTVDPTADTTVESDETVALTLTSGTGYTVGTTTAVTGTITNDDTNVTLAVSPSSVTEDGTTNLVYTFTRSGVTTNPLTVNYTVGGTATNGTDYTSIPTSVTFAAGSSTATVTVDPTADTTVESDETVALTLTSGTGYTVGTTTAVTGTINNDDFSQLSINNITVVEGQNSNAILTVTVNNPNPQAISVNYTTAPVNATANVDYTSKTGTITIAPNTSTATITIPILNDNLNEANETFAINLSNPVNATLTNNKGIVTISDTLTANVTTTLPANVENLTLTGTANINGTGNAGNNKITGNSGNNQINGRAGIDTLTGGLGADTFIFQFGQSTRSTTDHITDFAINSDKIDLLTQAGNATSAPSNFSRAANSTATTLQNLINQVFTDANGAITGNQGLGVNSAALVQVTTGAIAGTYLVINDSTAGFQSSNDLLINITGFTGALPALGNINVSNFFI